jgi:hypothetical protein
LLESAEIKLDMLLQFTEGSYYRFTGSAGGTPSPEKPPATGRGGALMARLQRICSIMLGGVLSIIL